MTKKFRYTYNGVYGKKIIEVMITDKTEPRDYHKKIVAAAKVTEIMRKEYGKYIYPVLARQLEEC